MYALLSQSFQENRDRIHNVLRYCHKRKITGVYVYIYVCIYRLGLYLCLRRVAKKCISDKYICLSFSSQVFHYYFVEIGNFFRGQNLHLCQSNCFLHLCLRLLYSLSLYYI